MPLAWAERISARRSPKVKPPRGGRAASRRATRASAIAAGVGEHVRRVGEQRQRVDHDADDDLDRHEADDQRQRADEPAPVRRWLPAERAR